jgi:hypothetical protein
MPTFTMELWEALELDPTIESEILQDYPIYDEGHREELNRKFLNHFINSEIGLEYISMWRLALKRKLDEIMPLYNQQYEISAIKFNQLETVNISNDNTSTGQTVSAGESGSTSSSNAKSRAVSQELPQTLLSNTGDYATAAQDNISDTEATGTGTETSTTDQNGTQNSVTSGFQGNKALLLLQYRQSLVNVDMMIIEELRNLFMLVWSNGDEFNSSYTGPYAYFGFGRFYL